MADNRLRFVHYGEDKWDSNSESIISSGIFETADEAKKYVRQLITDDQASGGRPSLFAEPMVLRYKSNVEDMPNVILAIGSVGDGIHGDRIHKRKVNSNNQIIFIDIANVEESIDSLENVLGDVSGTTVELKRLVGNIIAASGFDKDGNYVGDSSDKIIGDAESLDEAIKLISQYVIAHEGKAALKVEDTDTVDMVIDTDEKEGTTIKSEVKVPETRWYKGDEYNNILDVQKDGIFSNITLACKKSEDGQKLSLVVNGNITNEIDFDAEKHVVSGVYDEKTESIVLTMNDGSSVAIDVEKLIEEWTADEGTKTPVILTKEHIKYLHDHEYVWKDILSADVRLAEMTANILEKTSDGRGLFVKGTADNIKYGNTTVADALDKAYTRISDNEGNVIMEKSSGLYANIELEYNQMNNTLVFKKSQTNGSYVTTEMELNTFKFFDKIYYDKSREVIVIQYTNEKGEHGAIEIPAKDLFEEYIADNTNHNINIKLTRSEGGHSTISADVKILTEESDNILQDVNHSLYVKGTASNIKYGAKTVEDGLRSLEASLSSEIARAENAEDDLNDAILAEQTRAIDAEIELSNTLVSKITEEQTRAEKVEGEIKNSITSLTHIVVDDYIANISAVTDSNTAEIDELKGDIDFVSGKTISSVTVNKISDTKYELKANGASCGVIDIPADQFLKDVHFDSVSKKLYMTFVTSSGEKTIEVDLSSLIDTYEASDGLVKVDNKFLVKIDPTSEPYLTVSPNGVKVSGIDSAIAAVNEAVSKNKITFVDSSSIDFTVTVNENGGKNVTADAKVSQTNRNIVKLNADGIYAQSCDLTYSTGGNELTFTDSLGNVKVITLNSIDTIKNIYFDGVTKELVFQYTVEGDSKEVRIAAAAFFNGIIGTSDGNVAVTTALTSNSTTAITASLDVNDIIDNTSSTVTLTKTDGNKIKANVNIHGADDNWLLADSNDLYVKAKTASDIAYGTTTVYDALNDVEALAKEIDEKITAEEFKLNNIINAIQLKEDGSYTAPQGTKHLDNSTSVKDALIKLDEIISDVETKVVVIESKPNGAISVEKSDGEAKIGLKINPNSSDMLKQTENGLEISETWDCGTF